MEWNGFFFFLLVTRVSWTLRKFRYCEGEQEQTNRTKIAKKKVFYLSSVISSLPFHFSASLTVTRHENLISSFMVRMISGCLLSHCCIHSRSTIENHSHAEGFVFHIKFSFSYRSIQYTLVGIESYRGTSRNEEKKSKLSDIKSVNDYVQQSTEGWFEKFRHATLWTLETTKQSIHSSVYGLSSMELVPSCFYRKSWNLYCLENFPTNSQLIFQF